MTEKTIVDVSMNAHGVLNRRGFIRSVGLGAAGLASLSFTDLMAVHADDLRKKQMSCILLWMGGGPSHIDTFDPKPGTTGGETKAIETAVPGIQIAEHWPKTARMMKEIALIRSMNNKEGNHQRASYQLHTGYTPTGTVKHPGFGSIVAAELGDPKFDLPHIVSIGNGGQGSVGAGMLGVAYEPFLVNSPQTMPENTEPTVPTGRFRNRLDLLGSLEKAGFEQSGGKDRVRDHLSVYRQTAGMVLSPRMKAFDISGEDAKVRESYGNSSFGQGCLLARRLVQAGITFVEVRLGGWDMHDDIKGRMKNLAATTDTGYAALLADLKAKGMLDRTLVVWMGEFGRTPKINPRGGRDHFPRVFNVALAGGGIKGGQVIGSSNADGADVKDRPVAVVDLMSSFCQSLKIDPKKENMSPLGRPIKIVDGGKAVTELFA